MSIKFSCFRHPYSYSKTTHRKLGFPVVDEESRAQDIKNKYKCYKIWVDYIRILVCLFLEIWAKGQKNTHNNSTDNLVPKSRYHKTNILDIQ